MNRIVGFAKNESENNGTRRSEPQGLLRPGWWPVSPLQSLSTSLFTWSGFILKRHAGPDIKQGSEVEHGAQHQIETEEL